MLPISEQLLAPEAEDEPEEVERARIGDFIYEPEPEEILARLLPVYLETRAVPGVARVGGVRAGRAHDRDAERLEATRAS